MVRLGSRAYFKLEEHAAGILFIALVIILFWYAIWGLLDETSDTLKQKYGWSQTQIYLGCLGLVAALILLFPETLGRL